MPETVQETVARLALQHKMETWAKMHAVAMRDLRNILERHSDARAVPLRCWRQRARQGDTREKARAVLSALIVGHLVRQRAAPRLHHLDLLSQLAAAQQQQLRHEKATEEIRLSLQKSQQRSRLEAAKAKALQLRLQRAQQGGGREDAAMASLASRLGPRGMSRAAGEVDKAAPGKRNSLVELPSGVMSLIVRALPLPAVGVLLQVLRCSPTCVTLEQTDLAIGLWTPHISLNADPSFCRRPHR